MLDAAHDGRDDRKAGRVSRVRIELRVVEKRLGVDESLVAMMGFPCVAKAPCGRVCDLGPIAEIVQVAHFILAKRAIKHDITLGREERRRA